MSLIELLVAIGLLGAATVTILGAFGTLIKTSDLGRRTGDMGSALAAAADAVSDNARNTYVASCSPAYQPGPVPVGMTASIDVPVMSWDAAGGQGGTGAFVPCSGALSASHLQLITVKLRTDDGKVTRSISVVKRG